MPEPDTTPAACVWPDCLTPDQQTQLADEVTASMLGEPTTPMPDQRPICGCTEAGDVGTEFTRHADNPDWDGIEQVVAEALAIPDGTTPGTSGRTETGATTAKVQVTDGEPGDVGADTAASGFTWAQTVASYGTGPTATIDIDIHAPGHDEPVPVEIGLADARTLHDMLGGVLAEHDGGAATGDLRERYAAALWAAAERTIIAEWICCEPLNPRHDLCAQGYAALRMIRSCIIDDPEAHKPAPLPDTVLSVRDQEMQALRAEVQQQVDAKIGVAGEWGNALADNAQERVAHEEHRRWMTVVLDLPADTNWLAITAAITKMLRDREPARTAGCPHVREGGCCSGPGYCAHACATPPADQDRGTR